MTLNTFISDLTSQALSKLLLAEMKKKLLKEESNSNEELTFMNQWLILKLWT